MTTIPAPELALAESILTEAFAAEARAVILAGGVSDDGYTLRHAGRPYRLGPVRDWLSATIAAFEADGLSAGLLAALGPIQHAALLTSHPSEADLDRLLTEALAAPITRQRRRNRRAYRR